jgi:hypothetical protein
MHVWVIMEGVGCDQDRMVCCDKEPMKSRTV